MLYIVLKYITLKFYFHLTPIKGINKGGKNTKKLIVIEEEHIIIWPIEKAQTKICKNTEIYTMANTNTNNNVGELKCSGSVNSSYSSIDTRRVTLVTNPMASHK
jgi:hypothetical protein